MTAIIITGHGQFASGIHSALTLISGTSPDVHAVNFEEGRKHWVRNWQKY